MSGHLHSRFKDTLVNTIGHRASEHALQLGLLFQPAEALQVGLVDKVVPEDQVQSEALSVMTQWLAIPGEQHGGAAGTFRYPWKTETRLLAPLPAPA